jgi:hypothetical protein
MNPELTVFAENKVCDVIDNIKTMKDCDNAVKVIDAFANISKDKETVQSFRDYLCVKTFQMFDEMYGKHITTKIDTPIGEIDLV